MPVTERDYYELFPDGYHATGDIWMHLPSLGLVTATRVSGLVVTPACDLANCKTETVTYIPIVPVTAFLEMREFMGEISRYASESIEKLGFARPRSPKELYESALLERVESSPMEKGKEDLRHRCMMALKYLQRADQRSFPNKRTSEVVNEILGSGWKKIRERLVRNSYRPDIYYLPPDSQKESASA